MTAPTEYERGFKDGLQAAWDAIDKWIIIGEMTDVRKSERRNGMVLAANQVMEQIVRMDGS